MLFRSTTTVDPGPTTTSTIPQPAELPGEHVTAGTIELGANFRSEVASTCYMSGSVAGGEINIVKDEAGKIGAVYGKANIGSGDIGLVMVELGPLPMAVTAFRTTGQCNQDVVGIGGYQATPTSATFSSIGYGLFPNDFANNVSVILNVGGTDAGGSLNLQSAYDFLATPRS